MADYGNTGSGGHSGWTGTYGNGWTCQWCGSWVSSMGAHHVCPTATRWVNPPPPLELERIAAALERIATQLEGAD